MSEENSQQPVNNAAQLTLVEIPPTRVLIYEYGVTLDRECTATVGAQVQRARRLYNDLIAHMRDVVREVDARVVAALDERGRSLLVQVETLTRDFEAARAANDEAGMKSAAQSRRDTRRDLYPILSATKKRIRPELVPLYAKIGKSSTCITYQTRCRYVDEEGLGWGTANAVLDAALSAWKKCIARGLAPRFSIGSERLQDTLTLQFTVKGGLPSEKLLSGTHNELRLATDRGRTEMSFRLGAAVAETYATGTVHVSRELPKGSTVGLARLVRRRRAHRNEYALQLMVKLPEPMIVGTPKARQPLVALHFGWSPDPNGRRLAGIADSADAGGAQLLHLPPVIEQRLDEAAAIESQRSKNRDQIVPVLKAYAFSDYDRGRMPPTLIEDLDRLRKTRPQHVTATRLYHLSYQLSDLGVEVPGLKRDRRDWEVAYNTARRARVKRDEHWQSIARDLVSRYEVIVYEPLDLAAAAQKIDEETGARSEFTASARRGRTRAALSGLVAAIKWQCTKTQTPLVELIAAETVAVCSYCGTGHPVPTIRQDGSTDHQTLQCPNCGAHVDRKQNGAARAWQLTTVEIDRLKSEFEALSARLLAEQADKANERLAKMAEARRKAKEMRELNDAPA